MSFKKDKKNENAEPEREQIELSIEDLKNVSGTGEFDEVPTVKEGDYDNKIRKQS